MKMKLKKLNENLNCTPFVWVYVVKLIIFQTQLQLIVLHLTFKYFKKECKCLLILTPLVVPHHPIFCSLWDLSEYMSNDKFDAPTSLPSHHSGSMNRLMKKPIKTDIFIVFYQSSQPLMGDKHSLMVNTTASQEQKHHFCFIFYFYLCFLWTSNRECLNTDEEEHCVAHSKLDDWGL